MAKLQCKVERSSDDPEAVRLSLVNKDAGSLTYIDLDVASTERLMLRLAAVRGTLAEAVPETLDPNPRFDPSSVSTEPNWKVFARRPGSGGVHEVSLGLRHPGVGWLLYLFSAERATALAAALSREARRDFEADSRSEGHER